MYTQHLRMETGKLKHDRETDEEWKQRPKETNEHKIKKSNYSSSGIHTQRVATPQTVNKLLN